MKNFLTMPLKAAMAVALVAVLTGAKEAQVSRDVSRDAADKASDCHHADQAEKANKANRKKRHKLIRGMI